MISNKYITKEGFIVSAISGGRFHHSYRLPVHGLDRYNHTTSYGENLHSLSAIIFGTDEYWWALLDMNRPIKSFKMEAGLTIVLPGALVKNNSGVKKFV